MLKYILNIKMSICDLKRRKHTRLSFSEVQLVKIDSRTQFFMDTSFGSNWHVYGLLVWFLDFIFKLSDIFVTYNYRYSTADCYGLRNTRLDLEVKIVYDLRS